MDMDTLDEENSCQRKQNGTADPQCFNLGQKKKQNQ